MKKLCLVSFMCRGKIVSDFIELPIFNGKCVIHPSTINKLFLKFYGFIPERGETISFI